jgi:hypothetical protein
MQSVVLEFEIEQEFADEDPRAVFARDQIRVLADPAKPRSDSPSLVHQRLNVHAGFALCGGTFIFNPREQFFEFAADDIVIIVAPRVARDFTVRRVCVVCVRREIVEREDDDGARIREHLARVCASLRLARHPTHLAVIAAPQPLFQAHTLLCERRGGHDADFVEAQLKRTLPEARGELRGRELG